jgi:hypothetical protein
MGSGGGALLAGLALLIVTMGLLPFAPAVLGSLLEDSTGQGRPASPRDLASAEPGRVASNGPAALRTALASGGLATAGRSSARDALAVARINRVRAGHPAALNIRSNLAGAEFSGAFAVVRDFPEGTTFSHGKPLGPSLWTVSLDQLPDLHMLVPAGAPDVTLMMIEALSAGSVLIAQAVTVIVVEHGVGGERRDRDAAVGHGHAVHLRDAVFQPGTAPAPGEADVMMMRVARLQAPLRETGMSWSKVEPRDNLVHVVVPGRAPDGIGAVPEAAPVSLSDKIVPPDSSTAAAATGPGPQDAAVEPALRQPLAAFRQNLGPAREAPYEAGPLRPSASRGGPSPATPPAAEGTLAARQQTEQLSAPAAVPDEDEDTPRRLVRRAQKAEPEETSSHRQATDVQPANRNKRTDGDKPASGATSRPGGPPAEQRLGGPAPQRKPQLSPPPIKAPLPPSPKWNSRGEMIDGNKGI